MIRLTRFRLTTLLATSLLATGLLAPAAAAQQGPQHAALVGEMVRIEAGEVELLFPVEGEGPAQVEGFLIDATPVTNRQFLDFVTANPEWSPSNVPGVFANGAYLAHWSGDSDLGTSLPDAPVTGVSWFAAAAYCEARGARLPTEAEWEYVARAGFQQRDGYAEAGFRERVLALTNSRSPTPGSVRTGEPNAYGVYDLHGLVWEWVFDVGSGLNTADSRSEGNRRLQLVCGGGSAGAADKSDYAAFLRYAFRSGLSGNYSGGGLGFRCAS
ncbi:MAG TPA: formylglycine-generating enzyme family protein [Trueperaceae bacterium]|nr:formylglycine-generating enzyme family protein [Trueperaceae bacterium]